MGEKRHQRLPAAIISTMVLLPTITLSIYFATYFCLGRESVPYYMTDIGPSEGFRVYIRSYPFPGASLAVTRTFPTFWMANIFRPAALVESYFRGITVVPNGKRAND